MNFERKIFHSHVLVTSLLRQPIRRQDYSIRAKCLTPKQNRIPRNITGKIWMKPMCGSKIVKKKYVRVERRNVSFFYILIMKLLFLIRGTIFVALKKYSSPEILIVPVLIFITRIIHSLCWIAWTYYQNTRHISIKKTTRKSVQYFSWHC